MSTIDELRNRYDIAIRKMQTGVAMEMERIGSKETDPKHLRVGINSTMVDTSAIARALIKKGVLTEQEYFESLVELMEKEAADYEARVQSRLGPHVKLGPAGIGGGD